MRPLCEFPQEDLRKIKFILTDIDDTLTTNGRLPAKSYHALEKLHQADIKVIPITGPVSYTHLTLPTSDLV